MPSNNKRRVNYNLGDLETAKEAVTSGAMTSYRAAKHFCIPKATLISNLKGKIKSNKIGGRTLLNDDEENELVLWIFECAARGFPRTRNDVINAASSLRRKVNKEAPGVGKDWYQGFRKRHQEVSNRSVSVVSRASANVSENNIRGWHQQVTEYFTEKGLMNILQDHPEFVFNGDESGFQLAPDIKGKVLAKRGARNVFQVASGLEKVSVTAMYSICADGRLVPPMMLYKNNNKMLEIARKMPGNILKFFFIR